jgi:hypothetical protein
VEDYTVLVVFQATRRVCLSSENADAASKEAIKTVQEETAPGILLEVSTEVFKGKDLFAEREDELREGAVKMDSITIQRDPEDGSDKITGISMGGCDHPECQSLGAPPPGLLEAMASLMGGHAPEGSDEESPETLTFPTPEEINGN